MGEIENTKLNMDFSSKHLMRHVDVEDWVNRTSFEKHIIQSMQ